MQKLRLYAAFFLLACPVTVLAGAASPDEYIRLEVQPASLVMHPGVSGVVGFRFFPAEGIHVNIDPPVAFSLDSGGAVILKGKPLMTTDAKTGYLSTETLVTQEIALGGKVESGSVTVKGTVTYFFCSDSEGWCNRRKQPVEFTILVEP